VEEAHAEDRLHDKRQHGVINDEQCKRTLTKVPGRKTMPSVAMALVVFPSICAASEIWLAIELSYRVLIWNACKSPASVIAITMESSLHSRAYQVDLVLEPRLKSSRAVEQALQYRQVEAELPCSPRYLVTGAFRTMTLESARHALNNRRCREQHLGAVYRMSRKLVHTLVPL
jgi:hypothetical protein